MQPMQDPCSRSSLSSFSALSALGSRLSASFKLELELDTPGSQAQALGRLHTNVVGDMSLATAAAPPLPSLLPYNPVNLPYQSAKVSKNGTLLLTKRKKGLWLGS